MQYSYYISFLHVESVVAESVVVIKKLLQMQVKLASVLLLHLMVSVIDGYSEARA